MTRLDRGMYTVPIWIGLLLTGIYVMQQPLIESHFSDPVENVLGFLFVVSAALCCVGAALGTRWLYPAAKLSTAYWLEVVGLAGISILLGINAVVTDLTLWQQLTLGGGFGAIVQIGNLRMIGHLLWDLRRLHGR